MEGHQLTVQELLEFLTEAVRSSQLNPEGKVSHVEFGGLVKSTKITIHKKGIVIE